MTAKNRRANYIRTTYVDEAGRTRVMWVPRTPTCSCHHDGMKWDRDPACPLHGR